MQKLNDGIPVANKERLHAILQDVYFNNNSLFRADKKINPTNYEETEREVSIRVSDVKPYLPLFQRIEDKSIEILLPLFKLIRINKD